MSQTQPVNTMVPLHLCGNISADQDQRLQDLLHAAVQEAYQAILEQVDQQSADTVLDNGRKLTKEVVDLLLAAVERHTISDKFKNEQVSSERLYPSNYRVRPIEAQASELLRVFPNLKRCNEKLARRPKVEGSEAWFAIPRWEALAPTYGEAAAMMVEAIGHKRRLSDRLIGKLTDTFLRQSERTKLAFKILGEQQEGNDILVVGAQFGMLHRGSSARRTRVSLAGNEFCLGVFAVGSMLLTHPERLSTTETLMIDCGGDEYSVRGDNNFGRVPLFDYDMSGIEFSIFYEDRARDLWGTPTAFLYKLV